MPTAWAMGIHHRVMDGNSAEEEFYKLQERILIKPVQDFSIPMKMYY
jgi:hypothetical protein